MIDRDALTVCLRIETEADKFFFSDGYINLLEDFGSEVIRVFYQPKILTFTPSESVLSFDQSASVQSYQFAIADADSSFFLAFEDKEFEQAKVVIKIVKDGNIEEMYGVMSDVSHLEGQTEFSVRLSEENAGINTLDVFTNNSFQKIENIVPYKFQYKATWSKIPDVPWTVIAKEFNRTSIAKQPRYTRGATSFRYTGGRLDPTLVTAVDRILLNPTGAGTSFDDFKMYFNQIVTADIDPTIIGSEKFLEEGQRAYVLFNNPVPATTPTGTPLASLPVTGTYSEAWIGPGYQWTDERSPEIIRYMWFGAGYYDHNTGAWVDTSGDGKYWLSGIPCANDVGAYTSTYLDPAGILGLSYEENRPYVIKKVHNPYEVIAPADGGAPDAAGANCDFIWVTANGFVPDIDDPELGVGFIHLGQTYNTSPYTLESRQSPDYKEPTFSELLKAGTLDYKVFMRYKIVEVVTEVYMSDPELTGNEYDSSQTVTLLKIAIQDRVLDRNSHPYAVTIPMACGHLQTSVDESNVVEVYSLEYLVSEIDLLMSYIDNETYHELTDVSQRELLRDRYRGVRVDFLRNFQDFLTDVSNSNFFNVNVSDQGQIQQENASVIDNASGQFAVCAGSQVLYGDPNVQSAFAPPAYKLVERLSFHVPDVTGPNLAVPVEDDTDDNVVAGTITGSGVVGSQTREKLFSNYLSYKPIFSSIEEVNDLLDLGLSQVDEYFTKGKYRVIHDPVPENSPDLGKVYPVVYGYVKRVPMLQVISKKTLIENNETAGDDTYIYAQHPTTVKSATDIVIEYVQETNSRVELTEQGKRQRSTSSLKGEFAKSPFPKQERNHFYWANSLTTDYSGDYNGSINFYGIINNPYHKTGTIVSNDGYTYYTVQLRGGEWDERVGSLDKRYPIRNGLGNSILYASFGGWQDEDGEVITHPLDIIVHYIRNYGEYPLNEIAVDSASLEIVKASTANYKASVYIDESRPLFEFIDDLLKQFGIYWYIYGGVIYFSLGEIDQIDYTKFISDRKNLISKVSVDDNGYKDIYTSVIYRFNYNYITGNYEQEISLNKNNNRFCSKAARANNTGKEFVVEAKYQYRYNIAKQVALKTAKYLCSRHISYNVEVRKEAGVTYRPGDIIPFSHARLGVVKKPVLVKSVKEDYDRWFLELIRFVDVEYDEVIFEVGAGPSLAENLVAPVVSGIVKQGNTLTSTEGAWTASPTSYLYQWTRDGVDIPGEVTNSYIVTADDIRTDIACKVAAVNGAGTSAYTFSNSIASALKDIYDIFPNALIWSYEQGISVGIGSGIDQWNTVDNSSYVTQTNASIRPTLTANGVNFNGTTQYFNFVLADMLPLQGNANAVMYGIDNVDNTANTIRTVFGAYQSAVSTGVRNCVSSNFTAGISGPNLTRERGLYAGTSSALQLALTSLHDASGVGPFNVCMTSEGAGVSNGSHAYDMTPSTIGIPLASGTWPAFTAVYTHGVMGCERPHASFAVSNLLLCDMRYFVIIDEYATDAQIQIVRDALSAEGLL